MTNHNTMRIGADVGGTFTDVVLIDANGNIWTHKVPSTPPDFERAVLNAIEHLLRTTDAAGATVSEVAQRHHGGNQRCFRETRCENRANHHQRLPRCS